MKRSEAIEEIRKVLAMNGKDNGYGELEEAILHHLESLGMRPPRIQRWDGITYWGGISVIEDWEPEND